MTFSNNPIPPTNTSTPGQTQTTVPNKNNLSPDDFMKLFVTQLKNQNPLQPMDSSTMLQQMANYTTIQSDLNMQNSMQQLQNTMTASLNNSQVLTATQLIGKKVQIPSSVSPLTTVSIDSQWGLEKRQLGGSVLVTAPTSDVEVTIKDPRGNVVKTIDLGSASSKGLMDFTWDGTDDGGNLMAKDFYQISATALINGQKTQLNTAGSFQVKSVAASQDGQVILNLDGVGGKYLTDILKIM